MNELTADSKLRKIETEAYRARLNELNLLPNKYNLDLFFVAFEKKSEIQNSHNIFGQKAGKWILQTHNADGTPALAIKEFASKRKALTFIKNNLTGNFLICVRYKRDFERELADVPVQFYMHNLEEEGTVKQVTFRYEWKYIFDTNASTDEYYEKFEDFILGKVNDKEVIAPREKSALADDLAAKKSRRINVIKAIIYAGGIFLFADTIALFAYTSVEKITSLNNYLIGFGIASLIVLFLLILVEGLKVSKAIKAKKNQKNLVSTSTTEE